MEEVLQFVDCTAHRVAAMTGCHQEAGHQDWQQTLYLLHDWFWWPGMAAQMQKVISNCEQCIQHEGTQQKPQCDPSLLLHHWSCYRLTLPVLRQLCSWINPQM